MRAFGGWWRGSAPECAVCGRRIVGSFYRQADGRSSCASHRDLPRCRWCGIPGAGPGSHSGTCTSCAATAVLHAAEVVPVKDDLKAHMARLGVAVRTPTRIQLVDTPVRMSSDPHVLGTTTWGQRGSDVEGAITIKVLRGLPAPWFRHVIGHEFGHAAVAGTPGAVSLGPRVLEGFAEAVALLHLRESGVGGGADLEALLLAREDPVYGAGLRLVLPVVECRGLRTVLQALRANRPGEVGLPPT